MQQCRARGAQTRSQGHTSWARLGQPYEIADVGPCPAGLNTGRVTGSDKRVDGGYEWWTWR
jgi:NAD(P)-dependent dehydrogenase (short-subunit alcohol dehydrogenase family)